MRPGETCVTPECHTTFATAKHIHGPVAEKACNACHEDDIGGHKFPLKRKANETCTFCHTVAGTQKYQHKAVEHGCLSCHKPHISNVKYLLKEDTVEQVCDQCHQVPLKRNAHLPFAKGECTECHQPHQSKYAMLLRGGEGSQHCLMCHKDMAKRLQTASFAHQPAEKDCTTCHSPHSTDFKHQLVAAQQQLCFKCHKAIKTIVQRSPVKHGALTTGNQCANCHDPHTAGNPELLLARTDSVCLTCHDKAMKATDGRMLANMKPVLAESKYLHGPNRTGDCSACHGPHGAPYADLLERRFPETFYTSFDLKKYDLCFSCHEKELVLTPRTRTLTNFRDGDENLHYVHVNRQDKGRSCRTCHDVHGSNLPNHMASAVPFEGSKWMMPIDYQQMPDGGRCAGMPQAPDLQPQQGDDAAGKSIESSDDPRCVMTRRTSPIVANPGHLLTMMAAFVAVMLFCGVVRTQSAQPTKPTTAVPANTCTNAGCHTDVKDFKVVHGPVNVNACDACHKLVDPKQHKYELARAKTETCTFCHKLDMHGDAVVHKPVAEGQCLSCHNPHGGATAKFLRGKTTSDLCRTCHQDVIANKMHIHGPVAAGACEACHKAHSSPNKNLLVATGRDLCFSCHTEMRTQLASVKFKHKALEQECTNCHDPHASNYTMQIKQPPLQLCTSCHKDVKQVAIDSKVKHDAVTKGQACLNCHTPHGGNLAMLMKAEQIKICLKCHDQPIKPEDGGPVVASVSEILNPKLVKHGPVTEGSCDGCHSPHGSQQTRLLKKPYPEAFYQSFELDKYALCFSCHDKELVLTQKTTGLTNFRNGDTNLHYLHVNKSDRGRSCRACHAVHASDNPVEIRDSVPYGSWNMPINYRKTADGGSCSPGCHKHYAYDRKNPVDYEATPTPPSSQPVSLVNDGKDNP